MNITIYDVARYSGVSKSTVSRVLNNGERVSQGTRSKVMAAVKALNYKMNGVARGLVLRSSKTIAVVVQDIRNPFYSFASWYAEEQFRRHGYIMVIYNADNKALLEKEILDSIKYRRFDAVLSVGGNRDLTNMINFHLKDEIPVVLVDREVHGYDIPSVNLDNRYGGMLATDHLLDLGHRAILFATSDFNLAEMHRREGYTESLREHGVTPDDGLVISQSEEAWSRGTCPKLSERIAKGMVPTAIFASNDFKAMQVILILKQHGLSVPEDVSVVGYDDVAVAAMADPPLTTVRQPLEKMIAAGARLLLEILDGKFPDPREIVFRPELIERSSTKRIAANIGKIVAVE
jgi:DNA-binding LacI/PurR family transcriptional regulator